MNDVLDIARYIINYSNSRGYNISNLSLQKLLYFVQAFFLAFTDTHEPCFSDEIEAWDFGPVVPRAYREFKCFGSGHIPTIESFIVFDPQDIWSAHREYFNESIIPHGDRRLIDSVVDRFSDYSATDLVLLTHDQAPWKNAHTRHGNRVITKESIREYFEN